MKSLIIFISLLVIQLIVPHLIHAKDIPPVFRKLVARLEVDGLDGGYLHDLFARPELRLMPEAVAKSLIRKEANLNYAQFLEEYSVSRTISYLKAHNQILKKMENRFRVSAPVLVAILSVETSCGRYMGDFETVHILVTQILSQEPEIARRIYDQIPLEERSELDPNEMRKRLKKKSVRAYRELKALLAYVRDHNIDPLTVKGSIEGAIGLPQFLPSNIKSYGFDGNGDGKIDLFQHEDAIASIASFLKAHKWREDNNYRRKKKIIRRYNPSDYYASTVLKLAERLTHYWQ
jgi:membrane-bound lytic murein transglycosylase B